jgi:hypothetical protein
VKKRGGRSWRCLSGFSLAQLPNAWKSSVGMNENNAKQEWHEPFAPDFRAEKIDLLH